MTPLAEESRRKPPWLKLRLPTGPVYEQVMSLLSNCEINTVCQEAQCPNQWECFSSRTAAFLIMGPRCTRHCRFCAIEYGPAGPPDPEEPDRVAEAARSLGLRYVVVTSVTRDDLADGGASVFAAAIRAVKARQPEARVEVLIPDFQGEAGALETVLAARPDVLNHNLPRLYPSVRPGAVYARSLEVLHRAKSFAPALPVKSGLMLGLGESPQEIRRSCQDLLDAGCRLLTLGQYLQPSPRHLPVERYVLPAEFDHWQRIACAMGFSQVASGPFVRSSYHAAGLYGI
jgi:lipoyl synthase